MAKPQLEWMQQINEVLAADRTGWTAQEQAEFLIHSQSLIEAMIELQLKVQALGTQEMSDPPVTVESTQE